MRGKEPTRFKGFVPCIVKTWFGDKHGKPACQPRNDMTNNLRLPNIPNAQHGGPHLSHDAIARKALTPRHHCDLDQISWHTIQCRLRGTSLNPPTPFGGYQAWELSIRPQSPLQGQHRRICRGGGIWESGRVPLDLKIDVRNLWGPRSLTNNAQTCS